MIDLMLDIETLGTSPGCAVLSVGAIAFHAETFETRGTLLARIRPDTCQEAGLTAEPSTVSWWMTQPEAARADAFGGIWSLREAAEAFAHEWRRWAPRFVWSRGPDFDLGIWGAAMRAVGVEPPWSFGQACDVRSALRAAGVHSSDVERAGVAHTALGDAEHQLRCLRLACGRLRAA